MRLTKGEVFSACQALADADRCLVRAGRTREAGALGDLFELLEARMVADEVPFADLSRPADLLRLADESQLAGLSQTTGAGPSRAGPVGAQSPEGSYSIDSEFTQ